MQLHFSVTEVLAFQTGGVVAVAVAVRVTDWETVREEVTDWDTVRETVRESVGEKDWVGVTPEGCCVMEWEREGVKVAPLGFWVAE
jgi:hypothetical protein